MALALVPPSDDGFDASVDAQAGPPDAIPGVTLECTDIANAEKLIELHGHNLRHVGTWGKWLVWDGTRWPIDELGGIVECAKDTARVLAVLAEEELSAARISIFTIDPTWLTLTKKEKKTRLAGFDPEKQERMKDAELRLATAKARQAWAKTSQMEPRIYAMIDIAKSDTKVAVLHTALDADLFLLNVPNGTIDLRTGHLRPHRQADLITKLAPVYYDATAPRARFERFMLEICCDDAELVTFHKRFLGYALTGETREHIFAFWYGTGGNGKSVLANIVMRLMGDYACKAMPDIVFRVVGTEKHETELCDLHGRRLVFCNESKQGRVLDDGRIKDLTGGDPIRARRMREDSWQWNPTHKLVLFGQYKPTLRAVDGGMKRRTKLVPFAATFEGDRKDARLAESLEAEMMGILAYFVEGCLEWQRHGIPAATVVDRATDEYFREEDTIGLFFEAECSLHADHRITRKELRDRYIAWSEERDEKSLPAKSFSQAVRDKGGVEVRMRDAGGKVRDGWRGIRLLTAAESDGRQDAQDTRAQEQAQPSPMVQETLNEWLDEQDR